MKGTKILATFGPAISSKEKISKLISKGVNAFRINCSYGTTGDFEKAVEIIRAGSVHSEYPIGLLFDLGGPKLRLARFEGSLQIKPGECLTLTTEETDIPNRVLEVNHPAVIAYVKTGERLYIDDGQLRFEIIESNNDRVILKSIQGGVLFPGKGINLPDSNLEIATITEKDKVDLKTAVRLDVDFIALSFVRSGDDIIEARQLLKEANGSQKIIAKLEKREAIESLEEIMLLADGVMIARGDLGVEMPPEQVPQLQKKIISLANRHFKPVIVATQMLESMRFSPRATRAEISDVACAVFDFADSVMLSAETATGEYPVEAVSVMQDVIMATERAVRPISPAIEEHLLKSDILHAIAQAVSRSAEYIECATIFAFTSSGFTAAMISNLFPPQPVIALTPNRKVMSQLSLYRSVYALEITQPGSFNDMMDTVDEMSSRHKLANNGQTVIITGGAPFGSTVSTNFMMFHEVA